MAEKEIKEQKEIEPTKKEAPKEAEQSPRLEGKPVYCKNCKKEVIPIFEKGRWKCPDCKLFVKTKGKRIKGEIGAGEEGEKKDFKMSSLRPIALSGRDMALAEVMVNAGVAENFSDLTRKALHVLYGGLNLPFKNQELNSEEQIMEKENPDPKKTMKQIQEQEIMSAYAKKLSGNSESNPHKTMAQLQEQKMVDAFIQNMGNQGKQDPLQFMMLLRMLDNKEKGKEDNNFMKDFMQLQMLQSLKPQADTSSQREIADLKQQMQMQQILNQTQQKNAPNIQDQMMALEKVRADRDTKVKEAEIEAQKQRDDTLKILLDTKLKEMEKTVEEARAGGGNLGAKRVNELKEEITAIKEMSHELGDREKGAGEYIAETVTNVASQLQPAFTRYMEQKQQPPQPMPAEAYGAVQEPLPQEIPDMHLNPASDMTPSQQEMSDKMSDMYIRKKDEKT